MTLLSPGQGLTRLYIKLVVDENHKSWKLSVKVKGN